ncbi:MAG: hypothetical protein MJ193_04095, partial [Clostridia bacterium]|nr:hypothetical protein [Clostridia bacterium]
MIDKLVGKKWFVILIVTIFLVVAGRIIDNKSLSQSGVVVGIGIDKIDGEYDVSVLAVATPASVSTGNAESYVVYDAKDKTLTGAIDKINQKLGLIISLSHCNVAFVSKTAILTNAVELFVPLTNSLAMPEQAVVIIADEPKKALSSQMPTTVNVPTFITQSFIENLSNDGITSVSIKDCLSWSKSKSATVNFPIISLTEMTDKPISATAGEGKFFEIAFDENLLVSSGRSMTLDKKNSTALNIFVEHEVSNKINVDIAFGTVTFKILGKKLKWKVDGNNVKATVGLTLSFTEAQGFEMQKNS